MTKHINTQRPSQAKKRAPKTRSKSMVPRFIKKLFRMVSDPTNVHIIKWCDDGTQLIIVNRQSLVNECLPVYHMPANFQNFNRLLLYYRFKKVCSSRKEKSVTYVHPFFQQGNLHLL